MLHCISGVLNQAQLVVARDLIARAQFQDGRLSAGSAAVQVKQNEELNPQSAQLESLNNLVMGALVRNEEYKNAALPHRVAAPFYARYRNGMAYGEHVDDPVMGPQGARYRSDIAITLFLNAPDAYVGGELCIRTAFGEQEVKLNAGDAVLYPSSSLHRVNEVTDGERLVAVTWLQSLVRDPAQRELLFNLSVARDALMKSAPNADETARVGQAYVNLVRMWSDV